MTDRDGGEDVGVDALAGCALWLAVIVALTLALGVASYVVYRSLR